MFETKSDVQSCNLNSDQSYACERQKSDISF